ncbi:N(4)-(beta-N-acetylglucosaminyl)-L-asparaginase [Spiroplasma clarkii]|uniref:N(4)-(Beta-N-acetylglucosaminyl)-L-asparaginase n=1 Tax=Spiroplasma clarkii TaxID=2139 RepID=A0A2K8KKI5_9MOLU|nr:N(4)-(beta-N-acetylglucosaminyl)-L-asparaginase [Spiroplasma clarkii]ATX70761.1 N(4)-(beta-N-acetylglucosaminyl)-L-asparaginase [Spiroplasma clarkii]
MKYAMIGTWRMAYEAIANNIDQLKQSTAPGAALVQAIVEVENYPYFKSVGYGGLPNQECEVELDAAFMNGSTLAIGAIGGVKNIKNPIKLAHHLSQEKFNSFLVAAGAEKYAQQQGFEFTNMLTKRAQQHYQKKLDLLRSDPTLSPYDGHDTVGMVSLDSQNNLCVGTSTSGLFMKKPGRVGDSPVMGSGFYADSEVGGAVATGLGEDIYKGCLSFLVVEKLRQNFDVKTVVQEVVKEFNDKLIQKYGKCGPISIVALDKNGEYGVGTNCEFSFVVGNHNQVTTIYLAQPNEDLTKLTITKPSPKWLADYDRARKEPIK